MTRLIDADALLGKVQDYGEGQERLLLIDPYWVRKAPTIERPRGEWIKGKEISRTMLGDKSLHIDYKDFTCSVCGLVLDRMLYHVDGSPFYNFCPNCGADMRKEEEGESE